MPCLGTSGMSKSGIRRLSEAAQQQSPEAAEPRLSRPAFLQTLRRVRAVANPLCRPPASTSHGSPGGAGADPTTVFAHVHRAKQGAVSLLVQ